MTTTAPAATAQPVPAPAPADEAVRVSALRRVALGVTGLLACALPTVWGAGSVVMLATGIEADHRFHQVTGQGVLLAVLWLGALLPLLRAGFRGRRPSTVSGLHSLGFVAATVAAGALTQEAGAGPVAAITVVTTALVWAALPLRPRLRGSAAGLDPVLAPVALLAAALVIPFALGEVDLQQAMADEHAEMAHYFDMAWVTFGLVAMAALAALAPVARRLAIGATAGLLVVGVSRIVFTPDVTWSVLAMTLGGVGLALAVLRSRARA